MAGLDRQDRQDTTCCICLERLRPAAADSIDATIVVLACGHAFHGMNCLAPTIRASCLEAEERVRAELRGRFDMLGLSSADRHSVLGGRDFVEMRAAGQLRQCPQCSYGPVMNTHCGDLQAHDAERGHGPERTTNRCPTCNFFSPRWSDWAVWDPQDLASAARCPLCRDPCKLATGEVQRLTQELKKVDAQRDALNKQRSSMELRGEAVSTLLMLFAEQDEHMALDEDVLGSLVTLAESPSRASCLLGNRAFLDLLRQRLIVEEQSRMLFPDLEQRLRVSASERRTCAREMVTVFSSQAGFDGEACADELRVSYPGVAAVVLDRVRQLRTIDVEGMDSILEGLLAHSHCSQEPGASAQSVSEGSHDSGGLTDQGATEQAPSGGDIPTAIAAILKLLPDEEKVSRAMRRGELWLAMLAAEELKPSLENALRPVITCHASVAEAMRPFGWTDGPTGPADGHLKGVPDLQEIVQVLDTQLPTCSTSDPAPVQASGSSEEPPTQPPTSEDIDNVPPTLSRTELNRAILELAPRLSTSPCPGNAEDSEQGASPCLWEQCKVLEQRRADLALLLSTVRGQLDLAVAKTLGRPWTERERELSTAHRRLGRLTDLLLRHIRLQHLCNADSPVRSSRRWLAQEHIFGMIHVQAMEMEMEMDDISYEVAFLARESDDMPGDRRDRARDLEQRMLAVRRTMRGRRYAGMRRHSWMSRTDPRTDSEDPLQHDWDSMVREILILLMYRVLAT